MLRINTCSRCGVHEEVWTFHAGAGPLWRWAPVGGGRLGCAVFVAARRLHPWAVEAVEEPGGDREGIGKRCSQACGHTTPPWPLFREHAGLIWLRFVGRSTPAFFHLKMIVSWGNRDATLIWVGLRAGNKLELLLGHPTLACVVGGAVQRAARGARGRKCSFYFIF